MGFFSDDSTQAQHYQDVYQGDESNKGSFTHEAIGGAAAFSAARAYEQYQERNGKPQSYALAKELLAGFAGAEVDKLVETKGLDYVDREQAKRHAVQQAQEAVSQDFQ